MYMSTVFMHNRRGNQIQSQVVVSYNVFVENGTQGL